MNTTPEIWWPPGLPEWIQAKAEDDDLFASLSRSFRAYGWPAYNLPNLPREGTWPALALSLAQRIRELEEDAR